MEFLQSTLRNFRILQNCLQEESLDYLLIHVPNLTQNLAVFMRATKNCANDENLLHILTGVTNILKALLFQCDAFIKRSCVDRNVEVRLPVLRQGCSGRPKLLVPVSQITQLRNWGLSWIKIARTLNISRQSIWKVRHNMNINDSRAYSNISDEELNDILIEIKTQHPSAGYKYLWASLHARGIFVRWKELITHVRQIDPIGVLNRRRRRLKRRVYRVKGANYLWHMDGNEKLVNWNFYIHGCTDGLSRKIIYLELAVTKKAETVLQIFTREGVQKHGLPMRVRGDGGTENVGVAEYMRSRRYNIQSPFIAGRSVHNTRIERLWGEVNSVVSSSFRRIFFELERIELLSQRSILDLLCLIYIYFPRIQLSLDNFKKCWNMHGLRCANNSSPNELWLTSLFQLSHQTDVFSSQLVPEYLDLQMSTRRELQFPPSFAADLTVLNLNEDEISQFIQEAQALVPDPMLNDNAEGTLLYTTLRNHFLSQ